MTESTALVTLAEGDPSPRAAWLAARRQGIGGSDVAAIAGLDPWRTPLDVYHEKLGLVPDSDPSPAMERGRYLEDITAQLYVERTNRTVRRQPLRRHRDHEFMIGNVDRQIIWGLADEDSIDIRRNEGPGVLECKVPGLREFGRLQREGLRDAYILQMQHYLGVYGYAWGSFAVLNAERWGFLSFDVLFDAAIWEQLVEMERRFWNEHVLARVPPAEADATAIKLPEVTGKIVHRTDGEWSQGVQMLREARELKATASALEEEAKERIRELLGSYCVAEGAGGRVYYSLRPGKKSLDREALTRTLPLDRTKVALVLMSTLGKSDAERLMHELEATSLDLAQFEKTGKPYPELRFYALREESDHE